MDFLWSVRIENTEDIVNIPNESSILLRRIVYKYDKLVYLKLFLLKYHNFLYFLWANNNKNS